MYGGTELQKERLLLRTIGTEEAICGFMAMISTSPLIECWLHLDLEPIDG
jgi:hypothetical protein